MIPAYRLDMTRHHIYIYDYITKVNPTLKCTYSFTSVSSPFPCLPLSSLLIYPSRSFPLPASRVSFPPFPPINPSQRLDFRDCASLSLTHWIPGHS